MTGSHYEISPREKEDEAERYEHEFGPDESYPEYLDKLRGTDQSEQEQKPEW